MEEACLVHAAATELARNRSVEAISIRAEEGTISVATIGRVSDSGIAERIQESLAKVRVVQPAEHCRLLQSEPGCGRCEHPLVPIREQGFTITESGGAVTVARVRCPTVPKFWRWRDLPLPKIVPRQVSLPEDEADLNEWKAQAVGAGLCAVFGLAGYFTPAPSWSVPLYVASMLAGGWFAAREAFAKNPCADARHSLPHARRRGGQRGSGRLGRRGHAAFLVFDFRSVGTLCHGQNPAGDTFLVPDTHPRWPRWSTQLARSTRSRWTACRLDTAC